MDFSPFQNDQKAAPVLAALKVGKWRKARDRAKLICKKDRARYLPLLIAANAGLYGAMLAKGLNTDAETVLAYLRTIAPADFCEDLAREKLQQGETAAGNDQGTQSGNADLWGMILQLAGDLEARRPATGEAWLCVDEAVIANLAPPDSIPEDARAVIQMELDVVQAALEATGEGQWEKAKELLKSISSRSVFQNWRFFLRGVRHWFCGELAQARRCFLALPPEGACARAAAVIAGGDSAPGNVTLPTGAHQAAWWLAVTGEDVRRARALAEADVAWRKGSWKRAFDLVKPKREGFSAEEVQGLDSLWIDVFFPAGRPDSEVTERRLDEAGRFLDRTMSNPRFRHMVEWAERARILCDANLIPPPELWTDWTTFLNYLEMRLAKNPIRNSIGYQWLGEKMALPEVLPRFFFNRNPQRLKDETRAQKAFELAMELDPQNEGAALGLLALFDSTGKKSHRNRLLDELVERFPENKWILVRAGELAADRKAFTKSADFFRRACVLDPLDPEARAGLAGALVNRARDYRKKGRNTAEIWETIEPLLSDHPARLPLMLSRWSMRVRRFLVDSDQTASSRAFQEAESLAPIAAERLLLERLLGDLYNVKRRKNWAADWKSTPISDWATFERLIDVVIFCSLMREWKFSATTEAESLYLPALRKFLKTRIFEESPVAALCFVQRCRTLRRNGVSPESREIGYMIRNIIDAVGRRAEQLAKDTGNLHFRLVNMECRCEMRLIGFNDYQVRNLETLIKDAEAAGATDVAERARKLREEMRPGAPWDVDEPEENEDYDDWDEPADPFDAADVIGPIHKISMDLAAAILSGNESAIEKVRETALGMGIPKKEFEEMLDRYSSLFTNSSGRGSRKNTGASAGDEDQTTFDFGES